MAWPHPAQVVALKSPVGKVVRSSSAKWDEATTDLPEASHTPRFFLSCYKSPRVEHTAIQRYLQVMQSGSLWAVTKPLLCDVGDPPACLPAPLCMLTLTGTCWC